MVGQYQLFLWLAVFPVFSSGWEIRVTDLPLIMGVFGPAEISVVVVSMVLFEEKREAYTQWAANGMRIYPFRTTP